jgi:acid phosphatase
MKKSSAYLALITILLTFFPIFAFGAEPANLNIYKQKLVHYYESGEYDKDVHLVIEEAKSYLKNQLACCLFKEKSKKKPAIVFDIDETALSNYKNMIHLSFGGNKKLYSEAEDKADAPAIMPTLKLYQFAKANGIAIIFLTGRPENEKKRSSTIKNLVKAGYDKWDKLILKPKEYHNKPAGDYKAAMRKQLTEEGYQIILNIGDQQSDLVGSYAQKSFKLPNPYYHIP